MPLQFSKRLKLAGKLKPYFDYNWYKQQTPLARDLDAQATFRHYLKFGIKCKSPNPLFDIRWYLDSNPDVAQQVGKGVYTAPEHYINYGCRELRAPHPLFDIDWYVDQNKDVRTAAVRGGDEPLLHYLRAGNREGRAPHPLFWSRWYTCRNPKVVTEIAASGHSLLTNYVIQRADSQRSTHPLFDPVWYVKTYPHALKEMTATGETALHNYLVTGAKLGRSPHPLFDAAWYLSQYPDVRDAMLQGGDDALTHYLKIGHVEDRDIRPGADALDAPVVFSALVRDVANTGDNTGAAFLDKLRSFFYKPTLLVPASFYNMSVEISEDGSRYEAGDDDPQMFLQMADHDGGVFLERGNYRFSFSATCLSGKIVNPALYADFGAGVSEEPHQKFILMLGNDGRWNTKCYFHERTVGLRFDPSDLACVFKDLSLRIVKLHDTSNQSSTDVTHVYKNAYYEALATALGSRSPFYSPLKTVPTPCSSEQPKIIAFYLPQFHPIPENDQWWGRGFTEWTNVSKATPQFHGHYQPRLPGELGFYDLRESTVMQRQVELAKLYGISAFCFHYYWFQGHRLLERPLNSLLSDKTLDFPFCICWANENWTRRWDGAESDILMEQKHSPDDNAAVFDDLLKYLSDERYLRIEGKPLVVIYRPAIIQNFASLIETWRAAAESAGLVGIYIVATNAFGFMNEDGFDLDGICEFPPHAVVADNLLNDVSLLNEDFSGAVYEYSDAASFSIQRIQHMTARTGGYFPSVMAAWDNEARKPGRGHVFQNATPALFYRWLQAACNWSQNNNDPGANLVFINAWNEWGEGTYLEPDRRFGYAFLSAVAAYREAIMPLNEGLILLAKAVEVENARTCDNVACIHLYYTDMIEDFAVYIENIRKTLSIDVILTIPRSWSEAHALQAVKTLRPTRLIICENRGRDVLPFLKALDAAHDLGYIFGCKLHSKKSLHLASGDAWGQALMNALTETDFLREAMTTFRSEKKVGLVAPSSTIFSIEDPSTIRDNRSNIEAILLCLGISGFPLRDFIAGTMFWFRVAALDLLRALPYREEEFGPELGAIDGTIAHAIERLVPTLAQAAGFETRLYHHSRDSLTPYKMANN